MFKRLKTELDEVKKERDTAILDLKVVREELEALRKRNIESLLNPEKK